MAEDLKLKVAQACQVLAHTGLVREITGHVSARLPGTDEMVVRCRGAADPGVARTTVEDVKRVDLDGHSHELGETYKLQGEFSIHAEIYRARPDVGAVVHGHPSASLMCGLLSLPLRPIFGAYDPSAMLLAVDGVPVYPRAILISTPELGHEVVATMAGRDVCLLRGHGCVVTGPTVEDATVRAIKLETLAEITLRIASSGGNVPDLPPEDIAAIKDFIDARALEPTMNAWTWSFYLEQLATGS